MKLIIVLSDDAYNHEMNEIFSKSNIPVFSEIEIKGYKIKSKKESSDLTNWFASTQFPAYSLMNFAFTEDGKESRLLESINEFNKSVDHINPIHAFVLNVEKIV